MAEPPVAGQAVSLKFQIGGFAVFHPLARAVSATTYQERLLGSGLPEDAESMRRLDSLATQGRLRA